MLKQAGYQIFAFFACCSILCFSKQDDFIPEFELKKDLTPFVMCKHNFTLMVSIFILGLANSFFEVAKIIRGGFYLEKLFNQKSMKYYVLEYKNN